MKRKLVLIPLALLLIAATAGCSDNTGQLKEFETPETLADSQITKDAKGITETYALNKISPYSISPNFIEANLGGNNFSSMKAYVDRVVAAANDTGNMTKQEVELWHAIVAQESFSLNLVSNVSDKVDEIDRAMHDMAGQEGLSFSDMLSKYGMSEEEFRSFSESQAVKFLLDQE